MIGVKYFQYWIDIYTTISSHLECGGKETHTHTERNAKTIKKQKQCTWMIPVCIINWILFDFYLIEIQLQSIEMDKTH